LSARAGISTPYRTTLKQLVTNSLVLMHLYSGHDSISL
jgi:hypothetical protein